MGFHLPPRVLHGDALLGRRLPRSSEVLQDGSRVLHDHTLDLLHRRIDDHSGLTQGDRPEPPRFSSVRLYTVPEYRAMFAHAGLTPSAVHGGLDGRPLALDSRRLCLLARR